jgi:hypothetical protein
LACDLIVAGVDTPEVVEVAGISPRATWRDSGVSITGMLSGLGFPIPLVPDDEQAWPFILRAFGFWNLPLSDFYMPFLSRLPGWEEQDPLERSLILLLDELDHENSPPAREAVVARMRAAVRNALG